MTIKIPNKAAREIDDNLVKCLEFILEMDKMKSVKRRSPLLDLARTETDAEHSWHVALIALLLSDRAPKGVDIDRVIRMLLIHDIVEIDAGDTFLYDAKHQEAQQARERRAADKLFGLLPSPQGSDLKSLWEEFEAGETADARFARGVDRLQPLLLNYFSGGGTWNLPGVTREKVLNLKHPISNIDEGLWEFAKALIEEGAANGWLRESAKFNPDDTVLPEPGLDAVLEALASYPMSEAPADLLDTAREFEARFSRPFTKLIRFPENVLTTLHQPLQEGERNEETSSFALSVASLYDESVVGHIDTMGRVANGERVSREDSRAFFDAVIAIYHQLRGGLKYLSALDDTFCVSPEREGCWIAEALSCLPPGRSCHPNAKRMPHPDGLIVGLDTPSTQASYSRCVIIDGAIASGSTLIALLESLKSSIDEFHVFSAHATASSLRALSRYSAHAQIRLSLNVGHVSGILNRKRYALHEDGSLVIGDLGDLMSPALQ